MAQVGRERTSGPHWPRPGSEESEQGGEHGRDRLLEGPCFPAGSLGLILELVFSIVAVMPWIHWAEGSQAGSQRVPEFPTQETPNSRSHSLGPQPCPAPRPGRPIQSLAHSVLFPHRRVCFTIIH